MRCVLYNKEYPLDFPVRPPHFATMTKGIGRTGTRNDKTHIICRRCGKSSYNVQKSACASCGFGNSAKMRRFNHHYKAKRRRTQGTGRMTFMRHLSRRFKNGFREGTKAKARE